MGQRPFRFGVSFAGAPGRKELVERLRKAEDAGFSVVCTADHLTARHAVVPFLGSVSAMTSMRVSPMVIANDYRHPVVAARDGATIDILSEGRFELGIGTGWIKAQYDAAGLTYDLPKTRVDRLEEAVEVIKGVWSGERFDLDGEHYHVSGIQGPKPIQTPHPPICIAGSGPRMMRLAGREADIVAISPLRASVTSFDDFDQSMATSGDRIRAQLAWIREGAGDRFDALELSVTVNHLELSQDVDTDAERLANEWASSPDDILDSLHIVLGSHQRIVDTLVERREAYGLSYVVFSSLVLDDIAPVVSRLAGI